MSNTRPPQGKTPPRMPVNRHGGTPVRMKGEKLDFGVIKRIFSYLGTKQKFLMLL